VGSRIVWIEPQAFVAAADGTVCRRLPDRSARLGGIQEEVGVELAVLTGIGLLRTVALVWMLVVLTAQRGDLNAGWRAVLAWALVASAGIVTVWLATLRARRPTALLQVTPIAVELTVGLALMVFDGVVFQHGHVGSGQSSLAAAWPLAGVLSAGVALGEWVGFSAGVAMGVARFASAPLNGVTPTSLHSAEIVSFLSTLILYALAGVVSGYAVRLLRQADDEIARARARDDVSRTLHDGVLQTLALVERRAGDPQLAGMAREQERELRAFLAGYTGADDVPDHGRSGRGLLRRHHQSVVAPGQLEERLRRTSGRFEETYGARADVVVAPDVRPLDSSKAEALAGAVAEALVNAGKHGHATRVTIFVEPSEGGGVFCSVKDNGTGFEVEESPEGLGISGSIRGRVEDAGGRVEIDGASGRGAEVRMWL
jgi:signal transduction histidine kinase